MALNGNNEKWLNYLSLTTVLFAVCATLATFKGGGYSTKSLLSQSKASDQWAFYQSKSIKSYLYEMQKENLELQLMNPVSKQYTEEYQKRINTYAEKIKKYTTEKEKIEKEAKNFESIRDESKSHSERFGMAVIFLQVSILLSSISALTKNKALWYISMLVGAIGVFYFINGFMVLV
jgi:hypothetical protein